MTVWLLEYLNYECELKNMEVEVDEDVTEKDEVEYLAILQDRGDGDGIYQIISCDII